MGEGGGTPKGKARHTINLQEASYDVLMIQKESLQSSFVTDPDDGSFTQIPWYLMNNVDLNSSQRTLTQSQISNQTFKSLVQRFESLKMSQSSQVQPDDLYEREQRRKTLDANRYATKKTIAQGMLDVALLTANASQLKNVLQVGEDNHPFYHLMLSLIIISMILQALNGVVLLFIGPLKMGRNTAVEG